MAEILRTSAAEMLGRSSFDFVFKEDLEAATRLFQAKQRGDIDPFHFRLRRNDGSGVFVKVQGTPMFDAAGTFQGIVGTFGVVQRLSPSGLRTSARVSRRNSAGKKASKAAKTARDRR